jgi:hypothetical protein
MMMGFFDVRGVITIEWVFEGQMGNQKYCLVILTRPWDRVRKKRPENWKKKSRILDQDSAPAHSALAVKQFLADKFPPMLERATY